ncbi:MAG TPA: hypothetical protein VLA22_11075, partial [Gaiellaceae bacterium]|nr:hypothetical protein [Gaiellaceae bacterium]
DDAATRELDLEGDAPGSIEHLHLAHLGRPGCPTADPGFRRAIALRPKTLTGDEVGGVVEWE